MGYRDEKETLRARVAALEAELEDAESVIGRLLGLERAPETESREEHGVVLGAPARVHLERALDFEVSDEGLEAIAELLRARRPGVRISQVGRSLDAPGFTLRQADGTTVVALDGDLRHLPRGAVSASLLGGALGSLATFGLIHDFWFQLAEAHVLWMAPLAMTLIFALLRGRMGKSARAHATELRSTFERVVELARRHRVREAPRVRVPEAEAGEEVEVEADGARGDVEGASRAPDARSG